MERQRDLSGPDLPDLSGRRLLLCVVAWIVCSLAAGFATSAVLPRLLPVWGGDVSRLSAVIVAEVYALLVAAMLLAGGRDAARRLRLLPLRARELGDAVGWWAAAYAAAAVLYSAGSALTARFPSAVELARFLAFIGTDMGRLQNADAATWFFVLVRACLLSAIGEELLFRAALFGWLRRRLSARATIAITTAAFAAIHAFAFTMVPLALLVGVAAGYVRERTGSATPTLVVHVVQNILVVIAGVLSLP